MAMNRHPRTWLVNEVDGLDVGNYTPSKFWLHGFPPLCGAVQHHPGATSSGEVDHFLMCYLPEAKAVEMAAYDDYTKLDLWVMHADESLTLVLEGVDMPATAQETVNLARVALRISAA